LNWYSHSANLIKPFYPGLTWQIKTSERKVYLTFDDGPSPEVTQYVLGVLKEYGFHATFFCIGENVIKHPSIYASILAEGHSVGNHTFTHLNGFKNRNDIYLLNTAEAAKQIDSKLFRPPYGRIKFGQSRVLKQQYKIIMWSILSGDFDENLDLKNAERRIKSLTKPGSIVVFHDSNKALKNLRHLLPIYCAYLKANNYTSCQLS
jgi:peptidoglycan/xylan/chitin deacetylase (PgdA/CDA1 family)